MLKVVHVCVMLGCWLSLLRLTRPMVIRADPEGSPRPEVIERPSHHHSTHHRQRYPHTVNSYVLNPTLDPAFVSPRVAFAGQKPDMDPWPTVESESDLELFRQAVAAEERGRVSEDLDDGDLTLLGRRRRRSTGQPPATLVCPTRSDWVQRQTAKNMWGQTVQVLQRIDVDGVMVDQFFYETECLHHNTSCTGIDTDEYYSICRNHHILAYAKVIHMDGAQGWQLVSIPSACNCALFRKVSGLDEFLDFLEQMSQGR